MEWQWDWGNQDSFPGNVGTVLGGGGSEGWYRVRWDNGATNSYQYRPNHQDIIRYQDPLSDSLASLFPELDDAHYVSEGPSETGASPEILREHIKLDATEMVRSNLFPFALNTLASVWPVVTKLPKGVDSLMDALLALSAGSKSRVDTLISQETLPVLGMGGSPSGLLLLANAAKYGGEATLLRLEGSGALDLALAALRSDDKVSIGTALTLAAPLVQRPDGKHTLSKLSEKDLERLLLVLESVLEGNDQHLHVATFVLLEVIGGLPLPPYLRNAHLPRLRGVFRAYSRAQQESGSVVQAAFTCLQAWLQSEPIVLAELAVETAVLLEDFTRVNHVVATAKDPEVAARLLAVLTSSIEDRVDLAREKAIRLLLKADTIKRLVPVLIADPRPAGIKAKELARFATAVLSKNTADVVGPVVGPSMVKALLLGLSSPDVHDDTESVTTILNVLHARMVAKEGGKKMLPLVWASHEVLGAFEGSTGVIRLLINLIQGHRHSDIKLVETLVDVLGDVVSEVGGMDDALLRKAFSIIHPTLEMDDEVVEGDENSSSSQTLPLVLRLLEVVDASRRANDRLGGVFELVVACFVKHVESPELVKKTLKLMLDLVNEPREYAL